MAKNKSMQAELAPETNALVEIGGLGDLAPSIGPAYSVSPYVTFVSLKSPLFAKVAGAFPNLNEGEPVLFEGEQMTKLDDMTFYLIKASAHWSVCDPNGEIIKSYLDKDEGAKRRKETREHVETVLLVQVKDRLVPARCTFKTTKTRAAFTAWQTKDTAKSEIWASLSPEHKATLVVPDPRFRYKTTVKLQFGIISKSSGMKMTLAAGIVKPTTVADWGMLSKWLKDEATMKSLELCMVQFGERLDMITAKSE